MPRWHEIEPLLPQKEIRLRLRGNWRLPNLQEIAAELRQSAFSEAGSLREGASIVVDGSKLEAIDTAAAQALLSWLYEKVPKPFHSRIFWHELKPEFQRLIELVTQSKVRQSSGHAQKQRFNFLASIGKTSIELVGFLRELLAFVGATMLELGRTAIHPSRLRIREVFVQLEAVGLHAVPIVALVTFLIGIVIAYLFGIQIEKYGANIFIVDGCGIAMCRELSPILAAIILAGRSGSAFTAQLGAMKINEEIDAMSVLGLSPIRVLVVPRAIALMIALPLLVFVGDILGILGSMVIADLRLGITGVTFLNRLQSILTIRSFCVGIIKAPVFALFIAIIGCQMGLAVENNARSLGLGTTATVVRSIVAVILLNAGFAVLFSELRI